MEYLILLNGLKNFINMINSIKKINLGIIGLGYVGLPLALEFSKKRNVIGFDVNQTRVKQLNSAIDINLETSKKDIKNKKRINFTSNVQDLKKLNCYIITVPTPINKLKKPDLKPILKASRMIGNYINKNDLIIYESTVYPGCIEEKCVPVLEKYSKLKFNKDFFCGYSPERINPGDKKYTVSNIKKVTSGSTLEVAEIVDLLYNEIVNVGTHKAPSIKVAEAAKVIENTQRDLNIALINELAIIFKKMNLDTQEILDAAKSKWNFLPFNPGLVGGHCIGVDPYYLTYKAQSIGYKPKIILAGRKLNDDMGKFVANEFIKELKIKKIKVVSSKILIMGLTFKENCTDTRNSGISKVIKILNKKNCKVDLYDPWADKNEIKNLYGILPISKLYKNKYDGIIIAVAHDKFKKIKIQYLRNLCKKKQIIFDLKSIYKKEEVDLRL
jgi:UDP-N-acetyl-D-glucosamine/UDP-N-acetyl-D-galactosamine dehydrogenase